MGNANVIIVRNKEDFYEKTQILGMGRGGLYGYDILHRLQTQVNKGG